MSAWMEAYWRELLHLIQEMAPYLLLGFLFAGLLKVFLPRRLISRYMGRGNFRSALNATLLGIPMPLCSCGVLPAAMGFYRNGASRGASISFLISTPQTGIDSILATYAMMGWPMAVIRPVAALFTGLFGGVMGNMKERPGKGEPVEERQPDSETDRSSGKLKEMFRYGFLELVQDMGKWLVIGLLLAALLSVLVPDDFFVQHVADPYLGMFLMLLLSVPLYICATGSIPVAAVLIMKGLSPGAALVLLMAGPATNIATMTVIASTMGGRALRVYLFSIVSGALLFGTIVNAWLPAEWVFGGLSSARHGAMHEHGFGWLAQISAVLLVILLGNAWWQRWRSNRSPSQGEGTFKVLNMDVKEYGVEGMTCRHCKASVEDGLGALPGVEVVEADPGSNTVRIKAGELDDGLVRERIEHLGYRFSGRIEKEGLHDTE